MVVPRAGLSDAPLLADQDRRGRQPPRVSIGLPVFNGADFVGQAVGSILAQSYEDFELIISDNASTDRTGEICKSYAAKDPRIRLVRNTRNLGASRNWNQTFELASGVYFKWAAHDDVLRPDFLAQTVAALDAEPDAVLCQTLIEYIDGTGRPFDLYDSGLSDAGASGAAARFASLILQSHTCTELYGLIRSDALRRTRLHGSYHGGDRALLAELALRGRFIQLRAPLLQVRDHGARYTRTNAGPRERLAWHDPRRMGRLGIPSLRLYADYARAILRHVATRREQLRCCVHLMRWWLRNWNAVRVGVDLAAVIAPGLAGSAERIKWRVFGVPPGHRRLDREPAAGDEAGEYAVSRRPAR